ncbi:MAG: holo-ACP synthase [Acidimicrobiales bacterium]
MTAGPGLGVVGVGIDLVDVLRLREALGRRPRMEERLFSAVERRYSAGFVDPWPRLAARLAAKEAVMKALGVGLGAIGFTEMEIRNQPGGAPRLVLRGRAARLAAESGVSQWRCSLTHTSTMAEAVVVALGGPQAAPSAGAGGWAHLGSPVG